MENIENENIEACEKCLVPQGIHDELWCIAQQYKTVSNKLLSVAMKLSSEKNHLETEVAKLKEEAIQLRMLNDALFAQLPDPREKVETVNCSVSQKAQSKDMHAKKDF